MFLKIFNFFISAGLKKRKIYSFCFFVILELILYIFFKNIIFSIFLTCCFFFILSEIFTAVDEKRLEILHGELIEFAINIIIMIRAGKSVRSIIKDSVNWTRPPLKNYIRYLADELEISSFFDEAMDNFAKRCSSREAQLIATALKLNNKIGGDLVFILSNIVQTLQESLRVRSASRTITLQSRYSGNIIAFMPVLILIILFFFMNISIREFFASRIGNIFLITGAVLEISGIFFISRILKVNK